MSGGLTRLGAGIMMLLLVGVWPAGGQTTGDDRPVGVRVACRKGMGLIGSFWRGVAAGSAGVALDMELKAVRLHPGLVTAAWGPRRTGGGYDWAALDAAIDSLEALGTSVLLPLPVPNGDTADGWPDVVFDTVRHAAGRVAGFEICGEALAGERLERHLEAYESAVWKAYAADRKAQVGGPGTEWDSGGVEALVARCRERSLPLHFVSWQVAAVRPEDVGRSASAVREVVDRVAFRNPPRLLISAWRPARDASGATSDASALSSLFSLLGAEVDVACLEVLGDHEGLAAMVAFDQLVGVRLPMTIDGTDHGVEGIATLDGDEVIALFWKRQGTTPVAVSAQFSGIAWGRRIRMTQTTVDGNGQAEEQTLPMQDPVEASFALAPGQAIIVRVTPD